MNALRSAWHPVVFSLELNTEPVAATLLDTPLVIWRDSNGNPHASSDICVHRGTALSGGCVKGDNIMCPYHGWQFDSSGA
jgi:phenylpropionate dioxygenase-like ring-hydroxylating dioxygenase large terminal subunit